MSPFDTSLVWELARTTLWLALAAVSAALVLKLARVQSPALHRTAWCATLVVGCLVVRMPVEVPWYPAERVVAPPIEPEWQSTIVPLLEDEIAGGPPIETPPLDFDAELVAASEELSPSALRTSPPAAPSAEPPARWRPGWPQGMIAAWAFGMIAIAAVWVVGYSWFVWRLPSALASPADWQGQWNALLAGQGVRRRIPLRVTLNLGPLLCRLPRGYELLVPEPLWRRLNAAEREAILRHELAHWRRGDVWKSLAARVLALPHWFNPVSWWAVRRFDEAAEWACDRAATDDEPTAYARILVHLSELAGPRARYGSALRGRPLAARIRRLVSLEQKEDSAMKKAIVIAVAACLVIAALVRVQLVAQEPVAADNVQTAPEAPSAQSVEDLFRDDSPVDDSDERPLAVPADPPVAQAAPPAAEPDRAAAQKTVDTARAAYEAALAAYQAENTSLESVYVWSSRWSAAALSAARKPEDRIAAATEHLDRMRDLQQKIKALFDVGNRGGEALEMRSADFYVAEAERKLADVRARPMALPPGVPPTGDYTPRPAVRPTAPLGVVRPVPIPNVLEPQPGVPTYYAPAPRAARPRAQQPAPAATPPALQPSLDPQPSVPPTTLFSKASPPVGPQADKPQVERPVPRGKYPFGVVDPFGGPTAKTDLLYDNKMFNTWAAILVKELSPDRRAEALAAIGEFGANGWGPEAAKAILAVVRSPLSNKVVQAAVEAFQRIPADDATPAALAALKTGNSRQRSFVLSVLPDDQDRDEIVPLLESALADPDDNVAQLARLRLAVVDHGNRALADSLRAALAGSDIEDVRQALWLLGRPNWVVRGQPEIRVAPFPALTPQAVALLGHDNPALRHLAAECLLNQGRDAVEALEQEVSKSATAPTSIRARQLLDQLGKGNASPRQEFDWESR